MYDLIENKKKGMALTKEEISYMVKGFVNGEIPDYQMSAMLMAIYFQGMNDQEITYLTLEMAHSGDTVALSPIEGIKVDKHSTGEMCIRDRPGTVMTVILRLRHFNHWDFVNLSTRRFLEYY